MRRFAVIVVMLAGMPGAARAVPVATDLVLDDQLLQHLVEEQVYTDGDGSARVWDDGRDCNVLTLSTPQVSADAGLVRTRSAAAARIGTAVGGRCLSLVHWNGFVEIFQRPVTGALPGMVEFRVEDSRLYAGDGESRGVVGTLWEWIKSHAHPRFERLRIDLGATLRDLDALLAGVAPEPGLSPVAVTGVEADRGRVVLRLRFEMPIADVAALPAGPERALTDEELARWEAAWQNWDAFVTGMVKHAGGEAAEEDLRLDLLAVLLDARGDLQEVLTAAPAPGANPVPALFVKTWNRLAPLVRKLSSALPGEGALRYLAFVTAGDALAAMETVSGAAGMRLDADALRRLARMAAPALADPLHYDTAVDPDMRRLFGFGEPLPISAVVPPLGSGGDAPAVAGLPGRLLVFLPALALETDFDALVERVNGWVPKLRELREYLPLVQALLEHAGQETVAKKGIESPYRELYHQLLLATAWQESCWRQFVEVKGRIQPIRSYAGSVGIMQVNFRVWRGFYDVDSLLENVGYNARAGSEILHHYLVDYAVRKGEHKLDGGIDNLARASYSLYNGGPRHMRRYRNSQTPASLRAIDEAFWQKFQRIRAGDTLAVAECFTG